MMRVAYFGPFPPLRSGIADYSAELLPYLAQHAEIELFIDTGYRPRAEIAERFPVHDYRRFKKLQKQQGYDLCMYQMGNEVQYHEYVYRMLIQHPGVVVLHEYVLHHFFRELTLARGDKKGFVDEVRYCYGPAGVKLAQQAVNTGAPLDPWIFPLFERVVDASLGLIVHNEYTRQRVLQSRPLTRIAKVNQHFCLDALADGTRDLSLARAALDLPQDTFIIGSFGFVSAPKRQRVSLQAFARFRREFPDALYVLVGDVLPGSDVAQLVRAMRLEESVIFTGYVDLPTFLRYMAAVDVAVNLRFPTGGETSASAIRLMGMGKPIIVSNVGSFAEYPDDCCVKIDVDECEEETLLEMLRALAVHEGLGRQIGENAWRHIQAHHTLESSAQGYADFMQNVLAASPRPFAVAPLAPSASDEVLTQLINEVTAEMVNMGIDERDELILREVATAIVELGAV